MKTDNISFIKLFFNPFLKVAGLPAISFGALFIITGAMLAGFFNARFDGVIDLHFGSLKYFSQPLIDQLVVWSSLTLVFYTMSLILGANPRFLDIAGTFALARFPFSLAPLVNISGVFTKVTDNLRVMNPNHIVLPISGLELFVFIILILISLFLAVWLVALYFNAYKTCTNFKGNRLVISFILGLLISELLSVYLTRGLY